MLIGRALKKGPPMGLQDRLRIQLQTVEGERIPSIWRRSARLRAAVDAFGTFWRFGAEVPLALSTVRFLVALRRP